MGDLVLHGLWLWQGSVGVLEGLLQFLQQFLLLVGGGEFLVGHNSLEVQVCGDLVSSWHQVVKIHSLEEWLDVGSTGDLLLSHLLGDFPWILVDASNDSISVFPILHYLKKNLGSFI